MLTPERAEDFVQEWIAAWNSHDVDRIMSHWREDAQFTSPMVPVVMPEWGTTIDGKAALREYWETALTMITDLHFELDRFYLGADSLVIGYRNHRNQVCAEALWVDDDGYAYRGVAHYTDA